MAQVPPTPLDTALEPVRSSARPQEEDRIATPTARQPYRRQESWTSTGARYVYVPPEVEDVTDTEADDPNTHGLGLSGISEPVPRIKRVPVGSKDTLASAVSPSETNKTPLLSSTFSHATTPRDTPEHRGDKRGTTTTVKFAQQSVSSSIQDGAYEHTRDDISLIDHNHGVNGNCPTRGNILRREWSWFSSTIIILAIYSTLVSAIFLGIAFVKPRWGERIGTRGHVSFSTASLLSALFSKTIELSFVTVFVATLGQILSRKAFASSRTKGGISIAEMNMRLWIMQPGTLITNWIGVRYAATTLLGGLALIAAIAAIFYTTAAEALVSPKLKFGKNETRMLSGLVSASYANSLFLADNCATPISTITDPSDSGTTCLQLEHAGQGFHNLDTWLGAWASRIARGDTAVDNTTFGLRPPPVAVLFDNTTVRGQWITPSGEDITKDSKNAGRLIQNVTMAMPHANVFHAVRNPNNKILQPDDIQGAGEYYVKAAVPAPAINVLCVGLSTDEVRPLIRVNDTSGPPQWPVNTTIDKIFGWTQNPAVQGGEQAPVFPRLPLPFNTVINVTENWGPAAIYLLATPPSPALVRTNDHLLCSFKSMQYPNCTTAYHVAESGGQLTVHCDSDPENNLSYRKWQDKAPLGVWENNWKDVGAEWIRSVGLPQGITNSNASIARIMTQLIPAFNNETKLALLDPSVPTIGEALSVLAGCTLLLSSDSSPFIHYWNYSDTTYILKVPQHQFFRAQLSYKDYASGGSQSWQGIFYTVLIAVFALNVFCLAYLFWAFCHYGQVTDYTEPQNLFALAINSPPSNILAGACGSGPSGKMLSRKWCVDMSTGPGPGLSNHSSPVVPMNMNMNTGPYSSSSHSSPYQYQYQNGGRTTAYTTGISHPHFYVRSTADEPLYSSTTLQSQFQSPGLELDDRNDNNNNAQNRSQSPRSRFRKILKEKKRNRDENGTNNNNDDDDNENDDTGRRGRNPFSNMMMMRTRKGYGNTHERIHIQDFNIEESPAVEQYHRLSGR